MNNNKNNINRSNKRITIQLLSAVILIISGIVLLFLGFFFAPEGQIHNSVLIAFGESSTFAGALFGIDYTYKYKNKYAKK